MRKILLLTTIFFCCSGILMAQQKKPSGTTKRVAFKKNKTRVSKTIALKKSNSSPRVSPKDHKN